MIVVLLIDDDNDLRQMLRMRLQSMELNVVEASNGKTGILEFKRHRPHMVITDIMMPEKDGIETIKEIRVVDPEVPIIAISGGADKKYPDALSLARELGATQTIAKPFRLEKFEETVGELLLKSNKR